MVKVAAWGGDPEAPLGPCPVPGSVWTSQLVVRCGIPAALQGVVIYLWKLLVIQCGTAVGCDTRKGERRQRSLRRSSGGGWEL